MNQHLAARRFFGLLTALVALGATAAGQAYSAPTPLTVGGNPSSVASADLDGDGDLDVVATNATGSNISVLINNGGTFAAAVPFATPANPIGVVAEDFDGNGAPDIAVLFGQGNQLGVYLNDGIGNFSSNGVVTAGFAPFRMAAVDADGDGDMDLFVANNLVNAISLLVNDGAGNFSYGGAQTGVPGPTAFAFGDLDDDGDEDMAVACAGADVILIVRNDTTAFTPLNFVSVGAVPLDIAIFDANHDLRADIVTANTAGNSITLLRNLGGMNFSRVDTPTLPTPTGLAVTNADNALGLDIAVTCFDAWQTMVFANDGSGGFSAMHTAYTGINPFDVVSLDLDGDFDRDLLTVNFGDGTLSRLDNAEPSPFYPGTGEDIDVGTGVNANAASGPANSWKEVRAGDFVELRMFSPGSGLDNRHALLLAQFFYRGFPPISPAPGLHVNQFGFGAIVAIDSPALLPAGEMVQFNMPVGVEGLNLMVQSIVLDVMAQNGIYASSDGYELAIVF